MSDLVVRRVRWLDECQVRVRSHVREALNDRLRSQGESAHNVTAHGSRFPVCRHGKNERTG